MGVVIDFLERRKQQSLPEPVSEPAWSKNNDRTEVDTFHEYVLNSETWLNEGYWETLYEGYPFMPPAAPPHQDAVWYVGGDHKHFGVWLLNQSDKPVIKVDGHFGWNPGPTLYAVEREEHKEWILLVDGFQEQYYSAYRSRDLETWEPIGDEMRLPRGARHGSVIQLRN